MSHKRDIFEAKTRRRSRRWEKQHGKEKVVYRGVDPNLVLQVKAIAADLLVPEGEVARRLIEHALGCHARGDFDLHPRPNPYRSRMTLFPVRDDSTSSKMQPRRGKRPESHWRMITSWRHFPQELKEELSALAGGEGLNVPIGELVSALLDFGLREHRTGRLALKPAPPRTSFTLSREDPK